MTVEFVPIEDKKGVDFVPKVNFIPKDAAGTPQYLDAAGLKRLMGTDAYKLLGVEHGLEGAIEVVKSTIGGVKESVIKPGLGYMESFLKAVATPLAEEFEVASRQPARKLTPEFVGPIDPFVGPARKLTPEAEADISEAAKQRAEIFAGIATRLVGQLLLTSVETDADKHLKDVGALYIGHPLTKLPEQALNMMGGKAAVMEMGEEAPGAFLDTIGFLMTAKAITGAAGKLKHLRPLAIAAQGTGMKANAARGVLSALGYGTSAFIRDESVKSGLTMGSSYFAMNVVGGAAVESLKKVPLKPLQDFVAIPWVQERIYDVAESLNDSVVIATNEASASGDWDQWPFNFARTFVAALPVNMVQEMAVDLGMPGGGRVTTKGKGIKALLADAAESRLARDKGGFARIRSESPEFFEEYESGVAEEELRKSEQSKARAAITTEGRKVMRKINAQLAGMPSERTAETIETTESKQNRLAFRQQAKGAKAGYYEGRRVARKEMMALLASQRDTRREVNNAIIEHAKALPLSQRGRILALATRAETKKQLAKIITKIDEYEVDVKRKEAQTKLRVTLNKLKDENFGTTYNNLIKSVTSALTSKTPTSATIKMLEARREYIARNPDHNIPGKYIRALDRLGAIPVSKLSAEESDQIREFLTLVTHQAKTERRIKRSRFAKRGEVAGRDLAVKLVGGENVKSKEYQELRKQLRNEVKGVIEQKSLLEYSRDLTLGYHFNLARMNRVLRLLDGGEDGEHVRLFYDELEHAYTEKGIEVYDEIMGYENILKELGVTVADINDARITIPAKGERPARQISGTEQIEVWLAAQEEGKRDHLIVSNNYTETDIEYVMDNMTPEVRVVAEYILGYYSRQAQPIAEKYENATGKQLTLINNYSPIVTEITDIKSDTLADDMVKALQTERVMRSSATAMRQVERGFTVERQGPTGALNLDGIGNFYYNVNRFAHYKAYLDRLAVIHGIMNNESWRAAVSKMAGGDIILNELSKWVQESSGTGPVKESNAILGAMRWLRHNSAVANITYNLLPTLRAPQSFFYSIGYEGDVLNAQFHAIAASNAMANPKEFWRAADAIFPEAKLRYEMGPMREYREITEAELRRPPVPKNTLVGRGVAAAKKVYRGVRWTGSAPWAVLDGMTVRICAMAHYAKKKSQGWSDQDAHDYAWRSISRTQPKTEVQDIPPGWRNEISALFSQFQNMINQDYNVNHRDIPDIWRTNDWKTATGKTFWLLLWSRLIPFLALDTISRLRAPRKEELLGDAFSYSVAPYWPFGTIVSAYRYGQDGVSPAAFNFAGDIMKAVRYPKQRWYRATKAMLTLSRLPASGPVRAAEGTEALIKGETKDPRRLFVSERALEGESSGGGSRGGRTDSRGSGRGGRDG